MELTWTYLCKDSNKCMVLLHIYYLPITKLFNSRAFFSLSYLLQLSLFFYEKNLLQLSFVFLTTMNYLRKKKKISKKRKTFRDTEVKQ